MERKEGGEGGDDEEEEEEEAEPPVLLFVPAVLPAFPPAGRPDPPRPCATKTGSLV
jgi:hypothetical protein